MVWYIARRKSKGTVELLDWAFRSKGEMPREQDPELFDRLIAGWWKLCVLIPFIAFGVIYFQSH